MKQLWSPKWKGSSQPRKQRKYRHNAPFHVKRKFLSANLAPPLRESYGKRSMMLRKGDEVRIMRGGKKGAKGLVEKVDTKRGRIYVEGVKMTKVDGSAVAKPLSPSKVMITKLKLDDKKRQAVLERAGKTSKKDKKDEKQKGN